MKTKACPMSEKYEPHRPSLPAVLSVSRLFLLGVQMRTLLFTLTALVAFSIGFGWARYSDQRVDVARTELRQARVLAAYDACVDLYNRDSTGEMSRAQQGCGKLLPYATGAK
jgi:hypothetical protein